MGDGPMTARERMLGAAASIWKESSSDELFGGLSVTTIAKTAGVTRSTFYAHWPTTEHYVCDLVHHHAASLWGPPLEDFLRNPTALHAGPTQLVDRIRARCDHRVVSLLHDPAFTLRLGLASRVEDPDLADALRAAFETSDAFFARRLLSFDVTRGRELRPPLEPHHLAAALTTIADGVAVRHRLDPEGFPVAIYGLVAAALLTVMMRHPDDPRDLPEVLGSLNDWPTSGWIAAPPSSSIEGQPLTDDEVRALVLEARRLNSAEGWLEVSLARLASLTSTPESRVVRAFGSKAGLGLAMFLFDVAERYEQFVPTDDPVADVRAMIDIKAEELQRTTAIASSIVAIISGNVTYARPQTFPFDPHRPFAAAVRRAQDEGRFDPSIDTDELAGIFDNVVLFSNVRLAARRAPETDAIDLLFRGVMMPPVDR